MIHLQKKIAVLLIMIMVVVVSSNILIPVVQAAYWATFYVSTTGNDSNDGSRQSPFLTISKARDAVRAIAPSMGGDILVSIDSGTYFLNETIDFTKYDSGNNGNDGFRVIYKGNELDRPVISGGVRVTGFSPTVENPDIWVADYAGAEQIRSLYVNDKRRYTARDLKLVKGIATYNDPATTYANDGFYMNKKDIGIFNNIEDVELQWASEWKFLVAHVKNIIQDPNNANQVIVYMKQSFWEYNCTTLTTPKADFNLPFSVVNAFELLDTPGEFYYNKATEKLYYMPKAGEDMNTASVIVPKLEKLMRFTGNTKYDKIKNISFEGLKFAHTENYSLSFGSPQTEQSTAYSLPDNDSGFTATAAIELDRSRNIDFKGCYFFGFGNVGVHLQNAVENTDITGNIFSDIGHQSISLGNSWAVKDNMKQGGAGEDGDASWVFYGNIPTSNPYDYNLINGYSSWYRSNGDARVATSSYGMTGFEMHSLILGAEHLNKASYTSNDTLNAKTWKSDTADVGVKKAWARYDFDEKYSFSEITLGFNTSALAGAIRNNYEVLLSNDRNFTTGNYTVATQTGTALTSRLVSYPVGTTNKYRYLMIRTLGTTQLGLTNVWALTPDIKPYYTYEIVKNNVISNNYIVRTAVESISGGGIGAYYVTGNKVLHNEIINSGYSAIQWGWGWTAYSNDSAHTWTNEIKNNYIEDSVQYGIDGAAIYTLSPQRGSVISDNYIKGTFYANAAIYPDQNSSYMTFRDNVATDVQRNFYVWENSIKSNTFNHYYGTHSLAYIPYPTANAWDATKIKEFLPGNPSVGAYPIIKAAGLEADYTYLRNSVNNEEPVYPLIAERLAVPYTIPLNDGILYTGLLASVNNIINTGSFGPSLGQYNWDYKYRLMQALANYNAIATWTPAKYERLITLRNLIFNADKEINRYSFEATLAYCQELIAKAEAYDSYVVKTENTDPFYMLYNIQNADHEHFGGGICYYCARYNNGEIRPTFLATSLSNITNTVNSIAAAAQSPLDNTAKQTYTLALEAALNTLNGSAVTSDLEYVNVQGANKVSMDKENKTITVYANYDEGLLDRTIYFTPHANAETMYTYGTVKLDRDFPIQMHNKLSGIYNVWTLHVEPEKGIISSVITPRNWFTTSEEKNANITTLPDGGVFLAANTRPYMSKEYSNSLSNTVVNFNPGIYDGTVAIPASNARELNFILGAKSCEYFDFYGSSSNSDRFELKFQSGNAYLYAIRSGVRNQIAFTAATVLSKQNNTLAYSIQNDTMLSTINIILNGNTLFSTTVNKIDGRFFGYYSRDKGIKILP